MNHNEILTEKNYLLYAAQNYNNPQCHSTDEFMEDLRRIKYIKKLCTRYSESGELKERLILNHLIILSNVFKPEVLCRILCLKMENQLGYIKPFLMLINYWMDYIRNVKINRSIDTTNIVMDQGMIDAVRGIRDAQTITKGFDSLDSE